MQFTCQSVPAPKFFSMILRYTAKSGLPPLSANACSQYCLVSDTLLCVNFGEKVLSHGKPCLKSGHEYVVVAAPGAGWEGVKGGLAFRPKFRLILPLLEYLVQLLPGEFRANCNLSSRPVYSPQRTCHKPSGAAWQRHRRPQPPICSRRRGSATAAASQSWRCSPLLHW